MKNFLADFRSILTLPVWVAGLGYFVDMFDLTLFGVVRVESLVALGFTKGSPEILAAGVKLYNLQMIGMMAGGLLWGILGDKKGRLSVLFGSILLYSLGNIANAFVTTLDQYALCRFITGFGLAGELGAAITLVSEQLPKEKRGLGTTFVATLGLSGAVAASFFGMQVGWQTAYIVGGVLGILLLLTRFQMRESSLFNRLDTAGVKRGAISLLLKPRRFGIYIACILIGAPLYFATGILMTFSPELTQGLGIEGVQAPLTLLYGTIGLTIGDLFSGLLSQWLKSRKIALALCLMGAASLTALYLLFPVSAGAVYWIAFGIGIFVGYWAVLITVAAEQFGTNLRATVATSIPNFVRGTAVIATTAFLGLRSEMGAKWAAISIAVAVFSIALIATAALQETFGKDLDFLDR